MGTDLRMPATWPWAVELHDRPRGRWAVAVRTSIRSATSPDGWRWEQSGACPTVNTSTVADLVQAGYVADPWSRPTGELSKHCSRWRTGRDGYVLQLTEAGRREVADAST